MSTKATKYIIRKQVDYMKYELRNTNHIAQVRYIAWIGDLTWQ